MPKPKPTEQQIRMARDHLRDRLTGFGGGYEIERVLRVGGGSRPHVAVVVHGGRRCVVKDHAGCDPWFARWIGPLLAGREARALERLAGISGVPRLLARPDARSLVMSYIDAVPYRRVSRPLEQWGGFFHRMDSLVGEMHGRGVAHCDLRSPDNTLIDTSGAPAVVDFVASYCRGSRFNPLNCWLFIRFCEVDRSAIDKQKRTVAPQLASATDSRDGVLGALARRLGVTVRNAARLLFTRR